MDRAVRKDEYRLIRSCSSSGSFKVSLRTELDLEASNEASEEGAVSGLFGLGEEFVVAPGKDESSSDSKHERAPLVGVSPEIDSIFCFFLGVACWIRDKGEEVGNKERSVILY